MIQENEFKRNLIRCPRCNKAIGEQKGNEFYVRTYEKGKPKCIKIESKHDAGGQLKINCDCGGYFATTVKTLGMTYVIKKRKHVNKRT